KYLFLLDKNEAVVKVWDLEHRACTHAFQDDSRITAFLVTKNEMNVITGNLSGGIAIWDFNTGKLIRRLSGHKDIVNSLAVTPDSKFIFSGSSDRRACLWSFDGNPIRSFLENTSEISSVTFTPDLRCVLTGDGEGQIKIFEIETGKHLRTFPKGIKYLDSIVVTPDSRKFIVTSYFDDLRVFNIDTGQLLYHCRDYHMYTNSSVITPDGDCIIVRGNGILKILKMDTLKCIRTLPVPSKNLRNQSLVMTPDGKKLIANVLTDQLKNEIQILDIDSKVSSTFLTNTISDIDSVMISPDESSLFIAGRNNYVRMFDLSSGRIIRKFKGRRILSITSGSREIIVIGNADRTASLYDLKSGNILRTISCHTEHPFYAAAVTYDFKYLVAIIDQTVRVFEIGTGKFIFTLYRSQYFISGPILFTSNGKKFIIQEFNKYIIFDFKSGNKICEVRGNLNGIATKNGREYIIGSDGYEFGKIWDLESGECIATFLYKGPIHSATVNPDMTWCALGNWPGGITIWNIVTGKCIQTLKGHRQMVKSLTTIRKGKILISVGADGCVKFWEPLKSDKPLVTLYNLKDEGFLWAIEADETNPSGWFWSNREDLINTFECDSDGGDRTALSIDDTRRIEHISKNNIERIVMSSLQGVDAYQAEVTSFISRAKSLFIASQLNPFHLIPGSSKKNCSIPDSHMDSRENFT
ncbi:MAG: hypothetical protein HQK54_04145, partial [Oligoflexales bacterium]|nr:hypothetical protein [Oligoflexales bacterium]